MDFTGKKVLVFGAGISGIGAVKLLAEQGADIILYDGDIKLDEAELCAKLAEAGVNLEGADEGAQASEEAHALDESEQKAGKGVRIPADRLQIALGKVPEELFAQLSLVILSPGVPTDLPLVEKFRAAGIRIWGEVELAWECGQGDVLAVTGTNGKTTTTSLLGEIMRAYADEVYVVGNIGTSYTGVVSQMSEKAITVAEISSFQLETIDTFAPKVSAILNITPDHLNRHHTMEEYIRVKELITKNQGSDGICVLNYEDGILREFGESLKNEVRYDGGPASGGMDGSSADARQPRVLYFSSLHTLEEGIYLEKEDIIYAEEGKRIRLCSVRDLNLVGRHNHENVMAAAAMALAYGVPAETVREVICRFKAVEHRIEFVREHRGVVYYNDSKGTNPDAAIKGIQAMDRPTLLIGGGYDKNSSYEEWIQAFDGKVRYLVLIGQTREKIAQTARKCGFEDIVLADSLEEALQFCADHAENGDAVLLSPACASWGMFPNYEVRGRRFKELVNQLS